MNPNDYLNTIENMVFRSVIILLLTVTGNAELAAPAPSGLMCELLANPEAAIDGIGDAAPEFGWIVNSDISNDVQTACQIMVATNQSLLDQNNPDKWNSGKTAGANSVNVSYAGSALAVSTTYCWKVRIWNKNDQVSDWSAVQQFKTAASLSAYTTARYEQVVTEIKPVSVTRIEDGHYLVDFGKAAFGYLRWTIPQKLLRMGTSNQTIINMTHAGGGAGASAQTVQFYLGEKLLNGLVDKNPGGTIRSYSATQTLNGSRMYDIHVGYNKWIPAKFGNIGTFRYVEVVNTPYPVSQSDMTLFFLQNPFDDNAASFHCDNQILNDVWELCYYSMKETSWCGIFVDGDRERTPYEADAYINQLGYYYADREFSIGRYSHEYLMTHPTWPFEWRQHSIMMAWADYLYTGNRESLANNYTLLKSKLQQNYARSSDGLLNVPTSGTPRVIIDWPDPGELDGYNKTGVNAVVNAFYYHTLTLMKQIADVLGNTADSATFQAEANRIYNSFQAVFYSDPGTGGTGLYVDGEGAASSHSSIHANICPLAFGLVPEANKAAVINFVKTHERGGTNPGRIACSVYGVQYLLESLYLSAQEDVAMSILTNDTPTGWVNMMHEGTTVTLEAWGKAYKSNLDWNHAWGAAPANIIPRFVVGIRPMEAGFARVMIQPQPSTLNQFQIKTPTIRGTIMVAMIKQANNCTFQITIPANMIARFVLPKNCDGYTNITMDGNPAAPQQQGTLRFIDPVGSGSHVITAN